MLRRSLKQWATEETAGKQWDADASLNIPISQFPTSFFIQKLILKQRFISQHWEIRVKCEEHADS